VREREEADLRRIKAEKNSREELSSIIEAWAEAKRIQEFFADAERRAADLSDVERRMVLERLKLARDLERNHHDIFTLLPVRSSQSSTKFRIVLHITAKVLRKLSHCWLKSIRPMGTHFCLSVRISFKPFPVNGDFSRWSTIIGHGSNS
jgi:hypothetical protein